MRHLFRCHCTLVALCTLAFAGSPINAADSSYRPDHRFVRCYPLAGLPSYLSLQSVNAGGVSRRQVPMTILEALIRQATGPESWEQERGFIVEFKLMRTLHVRTTLENHQLIADLMEKLRWNRQSACWCQCPAD